MGGVQRAKEPEMRIKLLAKVVSTAGAHKVGDVVVLADEHARKMVQSKLAVEVDDAGNPVAAPPAAK